MAIQCDNINQTINELLIAFDNCKVVKPSDLIKLVELVAAVNVCSNGGANYNTLIQDLYEPTIDEIVTYPINAYHSISVMILQGKITQTINGSTVEYPTGTVLNYDVSTLNQTPFVFVAKAGSKIVVETLIETI